MAYDLSFSPEFFMLPGELYDGAEYPHGDRPYSVLGALRAMDPEDRCQMIEHLFWDMYAYAGPYDPEDCEILLERIQKTNTCSNLNSPVEVWIDPEGHWTIKVYDHEGRPCL